MRKEDEDGGEAGGEGTGDDLPMIEGAGGLEIYIGEPDDEGKNEQGG